MKRNMKALSLFALLSFIVACHKDDNKKIVPPRPFDEQYAVEQPLIEEYLKTHYIASVDDDFNVDIQEISELDDEVSIWDQTDYPLQNKQVNMGDVPMTLYYIVLREGAGEHPTRADGVLTAYRGFRFDGVEFDYNPYPQAFSTLSGSIMGWQEIVPFFGEGVYVDEPGSPDPAHYENYGAGIMFLPSAYGYYNETRLNIPAYTPLVFTFKLYDVTLLDSDNDGILNKYETENGIDIRDYDSDGDGTPNYLDTDDDGDGFTTKQEIQNPETGQPYSWETIPTCDSGIKKHLDAGCH